MSTNPGRRGPSVLLSAATMYGKRLLDPLRRRLHPLSWLAAVCTAASLLLAPTAGAAPVTVGVVLLDGTPFGSLPVGNPEQTAAGGVLQGQYVAVGFMTFQDFEQVAVYASLALPDPAVPIDVRAFLTTELGAQAGPGDVFAATEFTLTSSASTQLFTGLSLPAGTYYLTLAPAAAETDNFVWIAADDNSGATLITYQAGYIGESIVLTNDLADIAFPPAAFFAQPLPGGFHPFFQVTAVVDFPDEEVPEPSVLWLLAFAGVLAVSIRGSGSR